MCPTTWDRGRVDIAFHGRVSWDRTTNLRSDVLGHDPTGWDRRSDLVGPSSEFLVAGFQRRKSFVGFCPAYSYLVSIHVVACLILTRNAPFSLGRMKPVSCICPKAFDAVSLLIPRSLPASRTLMEISPLFWPLKRRYSSIRSARA